MWDGLVGEGEPGKERSRAVHELSRGRRTSSGVSGAPSEARRISSKKLREQMCILEPISSNIEEGGFAPGRRRAGEWMRETTRRPSREHHEVMKA